MAGRWIDNQQNQGRTRDQSSYPGDGPEPEERRFDRPDRFAARRSGPERDRVFGERESGGSYGGRPASTGYQGRPGLQKVAPRFGAEDGSQGGRFYGDDSRERVYREEYGQGYPEPSHRRASGGTGGYDYERGYGDGGREEDVRDRSAERWEGAGRGAGEFLHRAGERVASWFGAGGDARTYSGSYDQADHRGRGPQGYKRSDERINDDAHEHLTEDSWLDASGISLTVSNGEVTLSGTVNSRGDKHRAEQIVERLSGVTHVQNNLREKTIAGDAGPVDSVLGEQIREAGMPSRDAPATHISGSPISETSPTPDRKT